MVAITTDRVGCNSYMRYEARIQAYDVMDQVAVVTTLWVSSQHDAVVHDVLLRSVISIAGVGESDEREWLRDVLVAVIENL